MKTNAWIAAGTSAVLLCVSAGPTMAGGHDGWSTAGKILTGVVAGQMLFGGCQTTYVQTYACPPPVVVQQPVYYQQTYCPPPPPPPVVYVQPPPPPVYYAAPPVVYAPQPAYVSYAPTYVSCPPPVYVAHRTVMVQGGCGPRSYPSYGGRPSYGGHSSHRGGR